MRKDILTIATKKFRSLAKKYDQFINVLVDDWRGYRFVFDTEDVRNCNNDCTNCALFKLLQNEKAGFFSAGLYQASAKDKKIFGPQNFLNCKTLEQYKKCYTNFLIKETNTKQSILAELQLIKQSTIIYARGNDKLLLEKKFKNDIAQIVLNKTSGWKKNIIEKTMRCWD